jgi:hypothetical protein
VGKIAFLFRVGIVRERFCPRLTRLADAMMPTLRLQMTRSGPNHDAAAGSFSYHGAYSTRLASR